MQSKKILGNLLILAGIIFITLAFGPLVRDEIWYKLKQLKDQHFVLNGIDAQEDSVFARYLTTRPIRIIPVNKDFSLVIEKIGVNVPVIADVPVTDRDAYNKALRDGVAHAALSPYPSKEPGNVYIFAHASINFWEYGRYSSVFNLLRKLEVGDRVHVFYEQQMFVYEVVNKEVMKGWNTYPLTRAVVEPLLTLQTCDPPGTTINRLVVTSKLVEMTTDY